MRHFAWVGRIRDAPGLRYLAEKYIPSLPAGLIARDNGDITRGHIEASISKRSDTKQKDQYGNEIRHFRCADRRLSTVLQRTIADGWAVREDPFPDLEEDKHLHSVIRLEYKKGAQDELTNYRGVINSSILVKIVCGVIGPRLAAALDHVLPPTQGGFREGYQSTE